MKFYIVVPVFNAEPWIADCLRSILAQTEKDFGCIVYDDASTDGSGGILDGMRLDSRFQIVHNTENRGPLANTWDGFRRLKTEDDPGSVLTVVDGDDRLAYDRVLERVKVVYAEHPECLLTYGDFIREPGGAKSNCETFPPDVVARRDYRKHKFVSSHLRTFRSVVWNQIIEKDLRDPRTGGFFRAAGDVAFMMPMLEMAGDRFLLIPEVLYIYNQGNPLNENKVRVEEQTWVERYVRGLPKYPVFRGQRFYKQTTRIRHALVKNPLIWRLLVMRHELLERRKKGD